MDRRSEPRFQVYSPATVTELSDPEHQVDCILLDISATGMKLVADESLSVDGQLCVEFESSDIGFEILHWLGVGELNRLIQAKEDVSPLVLPPSTRESVWKSEAAPETGKKAVRDAQLGLLFIWTGCISAVLWLCAFLTQLGMSAVEDLAPLPVYGALVSAGCSLMWGRVANTQRARG